MAKYTMQEINDLNREGETILYPRMVIEYCCETEELARVAAGGTTYSPAEVSAAIQLIARGVAQELARGHSVHIGGIGTFTPSLALKTGAERESPDGKGAKRNAQSVCVGGVNFRADKELLCEVGRRCRLERLPGKGFRRHRSPYTPEERLELALRHLETHPVLTLADYVALTGLGRTTASIELRRWASLPGSGIGRDGFGTHRVYIKEKK